jgi:ankyrin repeat protein
VKTSKQSPELDSQLLLTARDGSLRRASLLIKAGADLEARNRDGWTPLLLSVRRGHTEIASLLLKAGANVNAKTGLYGWTALHVAAKNGLEDLTRQLLALGANVHAADGVNHWSALHYAVCYGEAAIVKLLLDAGADPNARDYGECTPLSLATNQGSKEVQAVFTSQSSKANKPGMSEAVASPETSGNLQPKEVLENLKSLLRATRNIRVAEVRRLLPLVDKAHLSHWRDYRGMTALGSAVTYWNSKKAGRNIKLLLEAGADPNVPSDAGSDRTPLFHARTVEHAELLLKYGADPNYLAHNNLSDGVWTPMASFIWNDDVELVKLGFAYGGRVPEVKMGGTRRLPVLEYAKEVGLACYPLLVGTKPGEGSEVETTKLTSNEPAKDQNVKTNEDFTVEDLLKRGWTRTLIDHFLGTEDYRNPVDHFRNYSGKKVFIRRRVELVEASPEFENSFVASAKRREMSDAAVDEVRARIAELRANRDQLRESNITVPTKEELVLRDIADLFSQARARGYRTPHKC